MTTQAVAAEALLPRQRVVDKPLTTTRLAKPVRLRLAFVDNLRLLLVVLLVLHHSAVTYGGDGIWFYKEQSADMLTAALLTLFVAVDQAFFMAFYFAIAAYFAEGSLQRKGARQFVASRLLRLGVPLAVQILVIGPLLSYVLSVVAWGFEGSLGDHLAIYVLRDRVVEPGSLWFVAALLLFSLAYAGWWRRSGRAEDDASDRPLPSDLAMAMFALGIGLLTFVLRLAYPVGRVLRPFGFQLAHFTQYIAWFIVGLLARQRGWLDSLGNDRGRAWGRVAILLILAAPLVFVAGGALGGSTAPFMGGMHWQSLVYAVLEQFLCLGMILGLLVAFRDRYHRQGALARELSSSAYAVYIIHTPVLVCITLAMRNWAVFPLVKFALASWLTVLACFPVAAAVRRLPGARSIL
jgi:fucose 4-O-acetylase-like acetyltransferase